MAILSRLFIICVGLVAAPAFAGKIVCGKSLDLAVRLEVPQLSEDERATLDGLLFLEGRAITWDERAEKIARDVLNRGFHQQPLTPAEFAALDAPAALVGVLSRARTPHFTRDSFGTETAVTSGQMLAIERMTLESLIGLGGVKMKWDRRLEGVAHYVVKNGRRREMLLPQDFDYLTRALRNGPSDPVMVEALMRVLRGPNI